MTGGGRGSAIKADPPPVKPHYSLTHTGSNMSRYEEVETILLETIRREQVLLQAANVRRGYCLAIVCSIDPARVGSLSHWLGAVDIASNEIARTEAVLRSLQEALWGLYWANRLAPF